MVRLPVQVCTYVFLILLVFLSYLSALDFSFLFNFRSFKSGVEFNKKVSD